MARCTTGPHRRIGHSHKAMVPNKFGSFWTHCATEPMFLFTVEERIVKPRAHDVVTDILDLSAELLVVNFSDAFLSLFFNEKEWKHWSRTVKANGLHTEASRLAFMSGALVSVRVAAYFSRLAQAVYHSAQEARLQTHVDDPSYPWLAPVNSGIERLQLRVLFGDGG